MRNSGWNETFKCYKYTGSHFDYTKGIYHDKWIGGVLHYTGMGKSGDQDIQWSQNKTLAECGSNGVDVHLFEVMDPGKYIYCGRIALVDKPYTEMQSGEDGNDRRVWMFPIRPVPDNEVIKPPLFVFSDMNEYRTRGKDVEKEYAEYLKHKSALGNRTQIPVVKKNLPKAPVAIPEDILGKSVKHKSFGIGIITEISNGTIMVDFDKVGPKKMGYELCMKNKLLDFI